MQEVTGSSPVSPTITKLDCTCGAVAITEYRQHKVRRHGNVDGCSERALRTVSFGFRDPQFRIIGVPVGICRRHEHDVGEGRMHVTWALPKGGEQGAAAALPYGRIAGAPSPSQAPHGGLSILAGKKGIRSKGKLTVTFQKRPPPQPAQTPPMRLQSWPRSEIRGS